MPQKKIVTYDGLQIYDEEIKDYIDDRAVTTIDTVDTSTGVPTSNAVKTYVEAQIAAEITGAINAAY